MPLLDAFLDYLPVESDGDPVDGDVMVQGVESRDWAIIEILDHGLVVRTIGRHGDCVEVSAVADVVGLELAVGEVPHLDMMIGFWLFGENLTLETQSECPSSWMLYLRWAMVFYSLMFLSGDLEKVTVITSLVWSLNLGKTNPMTDCNTFPSH